MEKYEWVEMVVRALHSAYQGAEVLWLRENFGNLSARQSRTMQMKAKR